MRSIYTIMYHCVYGRSLALAVQCETTHGVYEFRRGFCTLVLSFPSVTVMESLVQVTVVAGPPVEIQVRVISSESNVIPPDIVMSPVLIQF